MVEQSIFGGLVAVLVVVAFGYFIYRRVKASKERKATTTTGSGGGGGRGEPGNINQV